MLSGTSLSQPRTPWTVLPAIAFASKPSPVRRACQSSMTMGLRDQMAWGSRKSSHMRDGSPWHMPSQWQSGPPASCVARLYASQISVRRA